MNAFTARVQALLNLNFAPLPLANSLGQYDQLALTRHRGDMTDVAQIRNGMPTIVTRFRMRPANELFEPWPVVLSAVHNNPADALDQLLNWPDPLNRPEPPAGPRR